MRVHKLHIQQNWVQVLQVYTYIYIHANLQLHKQFRINEFIKKQNGKFLKLSTVTEVDDQIKRKWISTHPNELLK